MLELWSEAVRSIEPLVKPAHRDLWLRPIRVRRHRRRQDPPAGTEPLPQGVVRGQFPRLRSCRTWRRAPDDRSRSTSRSRSRTRHSRSRPAGLRVEARLRSGASADGARRSAVGPARAGQPLHLRQVRRRTDQPVRARRGPDGGREPRPRARTRSSSTAASGSARPTSCTPSGTRSTASTPTGSSRSSPARSSSPTSSAR